MTTQHLNHPDLNERLTALRASAGADFPPTLPGNVNNHIHTTYSFSPYSPSMALYRARMAGLVTAGIMDHDSIAGAREFRAAGDIYTMGVTCGIECRVSFKNTPYADVRINNPDQNGIVYMSLHGVPMRAFDTVQAFFAPYRAARGRRNAAMLANINDILAPHGIELDYQRDVEPLSMVHEGGSVTERHLLYALALRLMRELGAGAPISDFIEHKLGMPLAPKLRAWLDDENNPFYAYDLLGAFKGSFVQRFYIDADEECPDVGDVVALAARTGSIATYAYLGDVGESVTGDKRAQRFEDGYLDELFALLKDLGFQAITYMPTRNTAAQLERVRALCDRHGFFQVSGEDINSPRQSFLCEALRNPGFANLIDATWALIAHERLSEDDPAEGLFGARAVARHPDIVGRVQAFAQVGRGMFGR